MECYNDCLRETEELQDNANGALVLCHLGDIQMNELHNYSDASKIYLDALELLRGGQNDSDEERGIMTSLVFQIAQAHALAKDCESALFYLEEHIRLIESNPPKNEELLADTLFLMGNVLADTGKNADYDSAIEKYKECLGLKKKLYGPNDESVSLALYSLGAF